MPTHSTSTSSPVHCRSSSKQSSPSPPITISLYSSRSGPRWPTNTKPWPSSKATWSWFTQCPTKSSSSRRTSIPSPWSTSTELNKCATWQPPSDCTSFPKTAASWSSKTTSSFTSSTTKATNLMHCHSISLSRICKIFKATIYWLRSSIRAWAIIGWIMKPSRSILSKGIPKMTSNWMWLISSMLTLITFRRGKFTCLTPRLGWSGLSTISWPKFSAIHKSLSGNPTAKPSTLCKATTLFSCAKFKATVRSFKSTKSKSTAKSHMKDFNQFTTQHFSPTSKSATSFTWSFPTNLSTSSGTPKRIDSPKL